MKKYRVDILESWTFFVDIEAENEDKAEEKALNLVNKGELLQLTEHGKNLVANDQLDFWSPSEFEYVEAIEIKENK